MGHGSTKQKQCTVEGKLLQNYRVNHGPPNYPQWKYGFKKALLMDNGG